MLAIVWFVAVQPNTEILEGCLGRLRSKVMQHVLQLHIQRL